MTLSLYLLIFWGCHCREAGFKCMCVMPDMWPLNPEIICTSRGPPHSLEKSRLTQCLHIFTSAEKVTSALDFL